MIVIQRKVTEQIEIDTGNGLVVVTLSKLGQTNAKIGIDCPKHWRVRRRVPEQQEHNDANNSN